MQTVAENVRPSVKGPLLLQTLVPPPEPLFGGLDLAEPGTPHAMVSRLNEDRAMDCRDG